MPRGNHTRDRSGNQKSPKVQIGLILNSQETLMIDQLLETGLYGHTRQEVIHRLLDLQLWEWVNLGWVHPLKKKGSTKV